MEREVFGAAMEAMRGLEEQHWEAAMRVASVTAEGIMAGRPALEAYADAIFYALDTDEERALFEEFREYVARSIGPFESSDE